MRQVRRAAEGTGGVVTWAAMIAVAVAHGFRYANDAAHPELMDDPHLWSQLATALWKAAKERRGGPLTEFQGMVIGDREFVNLVLTGRVAV